MRVVNHFRAAIAAFAAIAAAMQMTGDARSEALTAMPAYKSRGHGLGLQHNKHSSRCVAHDKRDATKRRNVLRNRRAHA